jgi:anti-sigma factor RsiW
MITCRELAELLFDLTSGVLPPEQEKHVEQHLHQCCHCAAYVETYRLTIRLTRQLHRPPLPSDLAQKLQAILEKGDPSGLRE